MFETNYSLKITVVACWMAVTGSAALLYIASETRDSWISSSLPQSQPYMVGDIMKMSREELLKLDFCRLSQGQRHVLSARMLLMTIEAAAALLEQMTPTPCDLVK